MDVIASAISTVVSGRIGIITNDLHIDVGDSVGAPSSDQRLYFTRLQKNEVGKTRRDRLIQLSETWLKYHLLLRF